MGDDWRWEERLPQLVGCLLREGLTVSEAEEAVQEAAAALLARWDKVAPEGRFVWLLTVARNSWRRERRRTALERRSVRLMAHFLAETDVAEAVERSQEARERLRRVTAALWLLPLRRRLVLWLHASGLGGRRGRPSPGPAAGAGEAGGPSRQATAGGAAGTVGGDEPCGDRLIGFGRALGLL